MGATATHGQMAMPRAVHRDEAAEAAQQLQHAEQMEACWQHARELMADLADARRRSLAALN